jgi:hypothetical protein
VWPDQVKPSYNTFTTFVALLWGLYLIYRYYI